MAGGIGELLPVLVFASLSDATLTHTAALSIRSAAPNASDPLVAGHLPLLYSFSYRRQNLSLPEDSEDNPWIQITGTLPVPKASAIVPEGVLEFQVTVMDSLGARSTLQFGPFTVDPPYKVNLPLRSGGLMMPEYDPPGHQGEEPLECLLHGMLFAPADVAQQAGDLDLGLQLTSTSITMVSS